MSGLRKFSYDSHLYLGILFSVMIIMLAVTGFYLNHSHDWFHKQNVSYMSDDYDEMTASALQSFRAGEPRVLPEVVEIAAKEGVFTTDQVKSVNYAFHGLGYFYYVHLKDEAGTIVVVSEAGEIAKAYSDTAVKKWMHDLHVGIVDGFKFIWLNDVSAIVMVFLTITGIYLSVRVLRSKRIQRQRKKQKKQS